MEESDFLASTDVAIIGLGLMGGSMALALRNRCRSLFGYDHGQHTIEQARDMELFTHLSEQPDEFLSRADLVVLATPVHSIISLIKDLPKLHPGNPVVIDLGSTKSVIVRTMQDLPQRFDPVGGHPMCGREKSSLNFAEADLYVGTNFILTPLERTTLRGRDMAVNLVRAVGAVPIWLDPEFHDRMVAWTSHLPYLLANVLSSVVPIEATDVIGPGFKSTSRLAGSSIQMMADIIATNKKDVLLSMRAYMERLNSIHQFIQGEQVETLLNALAQGADKYWELMESSQNESKRPTVAESDSKI